MESNENNGTATDKDNRGRFTKGNQAAKGRSEPRPGAVFTVLNDESRPLGRKEMHEIFDGVITAERWAKMIDRVAMSCENNGSVRAFDSLRDFRYPRPKTESAEKIDMEELLRSVQAHHRAANQITQDASPQDDEDPQTP